MVSASTLPDDILAVIFTFARQLDQSESTDQSMLPVILSRVCAQWRRSALDLPCIWSHVILDLDRPTESGDFKRTRVYLQRANFTMLHLDLRCNNLANNLARDDRTQLDRLGSLIAPVLASSGSQIASLSLDFSDMVAFDFLISGLGALPASLERLILQFTSAAGVDSFAVYLHDLPRLRAVQSTKVDIVLPPSSNRTLNSRIEELSLISCHLAPAVSEQRCILDNMASYRLHASHPKPRLTDFDLLFTLINLKSLSLHATDIDLEDIPSPITLELLQNFTFFFDSRTSISYSNGIRMARYLLDKMHFPNVSTVTLSVLRVETRLITIDRVLEHLSEVGLPRIENLRVNHLAYTADCLSRLLDSLPTLRVLHLAASPVTDDILFTLSPGCPPMNDGYGCPNLLELNIESPLPGLPFHQNTSQYSIYALASLAHERLAAGRKLHRITCTADGRNFSSLGNMVDNLVLVDGLPHKAYHANAP